MKKQIVSLSLFFVFCLSASGYAGDCSEKCGGKSGSKIFEGVTFATSKQGQSVGFIDIDGDGASDMIVGTPHAASTFNPQPYSRAIERDCQNWGVGQH